jgi:hypothetical protein
MCGKAVAYSSQYVVLTYKTIRCEDQDNFEATYSLLLQDKIETVRYSKALALIYRVTRQRDPVYCRIIHYSSAYCLTDVRYKVFIAVTMKNSVFWDI